MKNWFVNIYLTRASDVVLFSINIYIRIDYKYDLIVRLKSYDKNTIANV